MVTKPSAVLIVIGASLRPILINMVTKLIILDNIYSVVFESCTEQQCNKTELHTHKYIRQIWLSQDRLNGRVNTVFEV